MSPLVMQLADSAFPSGGFTHSAGLEAAVQQGEVRGETEVRAFFADRLRQTGRGSLPFVNAAHAHPHSLPEWDALSEIFLINEVANAASREQGRSFLYACKRIFVQPAKESKELAPDLNLQGIDEMVRDRKLGPHHAPLFGAVTRALGIELVEVQQLFLYLSMRDLYSAAVRLGSIGTYCAQQWLAEDALERERVRASCATLGVEDVAQTAPLMELFQAGHTKLYSRLFRS